MQNPPLLRGLVLSAILAMTLTACGAEASAPAAAADSTASDSPVSDASESATSPTPSGKSSGESSGTSRVVPATLEFSAETVSGEAFEGASLAGRPTVLWFWAPWCPTCRAQIGGVSGLVDDYGDDVSFVGVGSLDEVSAIEDFAADVPADPADLPQLLDPDGAVWRHFGVVEQSTYVVLDAEGAVVSEGYLGDAELADLVSDLAA